MQQSLKRKIALEIVILFSAITLVCISYAVSWYIYKSNIRKTANIQNQISALTIDIDSLKSLFPKTKTFDELFINNLPDRFYVKTGEFDEFGIPIRKLKRYDSLNILDDNDENSASKNNIKKLYAILIDSKYEFAIFGEFGGRPIYKNFERDILNEIQNNDSNLSSRSTKNDELYRIHEFLKDENYLKENFDEFISSISGLPKPPPHSMWVKFQNLQKGLNDLKTELKIAVPKMHSSSEFKHIPCWIGIILLILIYPIRFLFILLIWSINVLKNKNESSSKKNDS
ncbi:hypothetical protein [Pedobacter sp. JCM 36344]|uniref:hypothetical protein n=1 Tax=Pedobacter sp. JCM 36344 TaxID=3374280 RepID=UPI00397881E0